MALLNKQKNVFSFLEINHKKYVLNLAQKLENYYFFQSVDKYWRHKQLLELPELVELLLKYAHDIQDDCLIMFHAIFSIIIRPHKNQDDCCLIPDFDTNNI